MSREKEYTDLDFWHDFYIYMENRSKWKKIGFEILWYMIPLVGGFVFTYNLFVLGVIV